jgi:hypothetical protein
MSTQKTSSTRNQTENNVGYPYVSSKSSRANTIARHGYKIENNVIFLKEKID